METIFGWNLIQETQRCEMKCGWNNDFVFIDGKNQMNRTVLTDVKLLCDSQDITNYTSEALTRYQDFSTFLAALSKCFFMIGYFIGGLIFGTVADAEGRWVWFLKQSMFWHFIWFSGSQRSSWRCCSARSAPASRPSSPSSLAQTNGANSHIQPFSHESQLCFPGFTQSQ